MKLGEVRFVGWVINTVLFSKTFKTYFYSKIHRISAVERVFYNLILQCAAVRHDKKFVQIVYL